MSSLRTTIIDALLDPPQYPGGGLADYSPDRASESTLADAVIHALRGTSLPVILDALGHTYRDGFLHIYSTVPNHTPRIEWDVFPVCGYGGDTPVLVVDNPATDEASW